MFGSKLIWVFSKLGYNRRPLSLTNHQRSSHRIWHCCNIDSRNNNPNTKIKRAVTYPYEHKTKRIAMHVRHFCNLLPHRTLPGRKTSSEMRFLCYLVQISTARKMLSELLPGGVAGSKENKCRSLGQSRALPFINQGLLVLHFWGSSFDTFHAAALNVKLLFFWT